MKYRYAGLACLALAAWAGSLGSGLGAFDVTTAAQAGAAGVRSSKRGTGDERNVTGVDGG